MLPNLLESFVSVPFHEALRRRFEELNAAVKGEGGWGGRDDIQVSSPMTLKDIARGGRGQVNAFYPQSRVFNWGCAVYRTPIQNLRGLKAVEVLPLLLLGARMRPDDQEPLLDEYRDTAVRTGAFEKVFGALTLIPPGMPPMDALVEVIGRLPDDRGMKAWDACAMIMGVWPYTVASLYRVLSGHSIRRPPRTRGAGLSEDFVTALGDIVPDPQAAVNFWDTYTVTLSTHSVNLSARAAQDCATGGGSPRTCVRVGLLDLSVPGHGGAQALIGSMIDDLKSYAQLLPGDLPSDDIIIAWAADRMQRHLKIDGVGHAVINGQHDPRAIVFLDLLTTSAEISEQWDFKLLAHLADRFPTVLLSPQIAKIHRIANPYVNVDFFAGPAQRYFLGIEDPQLTILAFAYARSMDYMAAALLARASGLALARADNLDETDVREHLQGA